MEYKLQVSGSCRVLFKKWNFVFCVLLLLFTAGVTQTDAVAECGVVRTPGVGPAHRIVGGSNAREGQFPWMVMLVKDGGFICGGTIIDPLHVITAAHCFEDNIVTLTGTSVENSQSVQYVNTSGLEIIAGKHQYAIYNFNNYREQRVAVAAGLPHQRYKLDSGEFSNDITLLRLERNLTFNDRVSPLCLPTETSGIPQQCTIAGWGAIDPYSTTPAVLQTATLTAYSREQCLWLQPLMSSYYKLIFEVNLQKALAQNTMCITNVTDGGEETCFGDSGGPIFCLRPGGQQYELIGVVSWGYGDCPALPAFPSVNTFVPAFIPWIRSSMVAVENPCARNPCTFFQLCLSTGDSFLCICTNGYTGAYCNQLTECGQTLTSSQGTFSTPNYPLHYPNLANCEWTIPLDSQAVGVNLTIQDMDIELTSPCLYDYLEIRQTNSQGPLLLPKLCGRTPPATIQSYTSLWIHFLSGYSIDSGKGFIANYTIVAPAAPPTTSTPLTTATTTTMINGGNSTVGNDTTTSSSSPTTTTTMMIGGNSTVGNDTTTKKNVTNTDPTGSGDKTEAKSSVAFSLSILTVMLFV